LTVSRREDLAWGVRNGALFGGLYSIVVVILYAVDGPRRFDKINVALPALIALYLLGGFSAGLVLGAFRSALRQRYSAFGVSVLAAIPVAVGTTVLVTSNGRHWTAKEWFVATFMSLFIAAAGMGAFWENPEDVGSG
jgi:hypothetical protein